MEDDQEYFDRTGSGGDARHEEGAEQVIETVLTVIAEALKKGEKVDLRGFGRFQVNEKKERQGRNPKTGETMTIAARSVAVFKPSKELAEDLNESPLASDKTA